MAPSTVEETVTVTAEAPLIDTTQSRASGNVDPRQVQELPLNGRNWMDLTVLAPGSRANATSAESPVGATTRGYFQVNIDGQQVTNNVSGGYVQPGFSRDAIAEFEFLSNRFDASLGRSLGAQVHSITKSGTNTPSGTFSRYFRDDRFNAADHIAGRVLPCSNTQLSTTLGGPLVRDRIHIFGAYEYENEPFTILYTSRGRRSTSTRSSRAAVRRSPCGWTSNARRRRALRSAATSRSMNPPARAAAERQTTRRGSSAWITPPTGCWRRSPR
jgi:hypothetical protein